MKTAAVAMLLALPAALAGPFAHFGKQFEKLDAQFEALETQMTSSFAQQQQAWNPVASEAAGQYHASSSYSHTAADGTTVSRTVRAYADSAGQEVEEEIRTHGDQELRMRSTKALDAPPQVVYEINGAVADISEEAFLDLWEDRHPTVGLPSSESAESAESSDL